MTKNNQSILGSRDRLGEPKSGSIQPDYMPQARDIVALVEHSPPLTFF